MFETIIDIHNYVKFYESLLKNERVVIYPAQKVALPVHQW